MKFDMGGSAATLGATKAIGQIKLAGVEASTAYGLLKKLKLRKKKKKKGSCKCLMC